MIDKEAYQLPPQEGFVLTHFLTVADVKRWQSSTSEY